MNQHSVELNELFTALAMAQGEGIAALKDTLGQIGQSQKKYADLASCWEACRAPLAKHGLCVVQVPSSDGPKVTVDTWLGHKSGQFMSCSFSMTSTVMTPQGLGSALTYARRYSLCAMVGISPEDDDGAAASQGTKEAAAKVGEEKIRKLKAQAAPPQVAEQEQGPDDGLGVSEADIEAKASGAPEFKRMMEGFEAIKAEFFKLDRVDAYYQILDEFGGWKHANQIRPLSAARGVYRAMGKRKAELLEEAIGAPV